MFLIGILWDSKLGKFPDLAFEVVSDFWDFLIIDFDVSYSDERYLLSICVKKYFKEFLHFTLASRSPVEWVQKI